MICQLYDLQPMFASRLRIGKPFGYNVCLMGQFIHKSDPLTDDEWSRLIEIIKAVGNATVARRFIGVTRPLGAGAQTVPTESMIGLTEGRWSILGDEDLPVRTFTKRGDIVPLISKDFILHWRDVEEARLMGQKLSLAKAAAAAAGCSRSEDMLVLNGYSPLGYMGLMTIAGRTHIAGLQWMNPGDAFRNFTLLTQTLKSNGYTGPFAAVVHPGIYASLHRVLEGSSLLEIAHIRAILSGGVFRSSLLAPRSGVVVSTGRQNLELVVSIDTSVAYLGAKRMNLPFRVFKAVYLRILRSDAICTF